MIRRAFVQVLTLGILVIRPMPGQVALTGGPFSASPRALLEETSHYNPEGKHVATVTLRESRYRFDREGRARITHWTVYRILSRDAEDWAEVSQTWSSWRENRPIVRARVITPDGSIHLLDPKTIEEGSAADSSPEVYSDRKWLRAPLPSIVEGSVVETLVEVEETNPFFGVGTVRQYYLSLDVPQNRTRVTIDYPADLPLRYLVQLSPELRQERRESGDRVTLTFETGPSDVAKDIPPNLPSDAPRWPSIVFGASGSWSSVAKRFGKILDEQIAAEDLRNQLPQVPRGATREQIATTLLSYVHEKVRYTGVEFGEAAWLPWKPSETLKRGFGDCKDKAAVLIALFRAAGVDARLALLNTGPGPDIAPEIPGLGLFDHAIVYIPGEPALWIDATDVGARPGQLPATDQGRRALIVGEGTTDLVFTPASGPADNRTVETRKFFMPTIGKARVVETTEAWGAVDVFMRDDYEEIDDEELRKGFQSYGESAYLSKKLARLDRGNVKDFSRPFSVEAEYLESGRGVVDQSEAVVAIRREDLFRELPDWLKEDQPAQSQPRTQDIELLVPFTVDWHYDIHAPAGFHPRELPAVETRKLGGATYSHRFESSPDGDVTGYIHFDTGNRRMTAGDAMKLRDGVAGILKAPPILIFLDHTGEKSLGEGKIGDALVEFRKLSAAEPKEAIPRTRIARALLAAGIGEEARQEARGAVVLDPSSAIAHQTLGWVLQHDLIGRRFEKGFDLQAAIASYTKAKELDPENAAIRGDLAILLEHNVHGERYGKGADLAQAIEEYRALMKLQDGANLLDNLLIVCLHAGRTDVLKEQLAEDMPQDEARWPLYLAVQAVVNGSAEAVQRATRSIPDTQKRNLALAQAGLVLMRGRNYSKASELYTAAARGGQNTAQLLALADQLRKVRRWEEVQTRSDTPEGVVQQFLLAFWGAEDPAKAVQLLSRHHQQDRFHEENIQEWKRVQRPLRSQMAKVGLDTDIVADMMVVMMQASVEGDDQVGYLVKHRLPNANITAIIVKEGGQYRILDVISGSSSSVGFAGYEVLARVEQGRLAEARRLLDWIRDEISPTGGDDPLAGPLFVRFWRKGEPGSAAAMRQAGCALLLGNKSTAGDAIRFLKSDLQNESDAAARGRLQLALAVAYGQVAQFGELVDIAISLYTRHPTSQIAFSMVCSALTNLGRWDELDRYIETRVQKDARDPDAIRARLLAAVWRGDLEVGRKQEDILRQSGKLEAGDLNNLAWLALVAGKVDERALQTIQEGILQSQSNPNAAFLHTAASIYAEVGKTAEAREVLLQSIDLRGIDEPDGDSWYVLGRIAEDYGEVKAARKMYGRVKKPENPRETLSSTFALAQRRIGQLKDTN